MRYKGEAVNRVTLYKTVGPEFAYDATISFNFAAGARFTCYVEGGTTGGGSAAKPTVAVYGAFA